MRNKDIVEPSLPITKKERKGRMKGKRPKYVLKLPSQKAPVFESPIIQKNPSTTANVVPIPSQPSIVESTPSQPSIDQPMPSQPPIVQPVQPHVNELIPSSMASQCVGARLTSLSSPSPQNDSPTSIPSRLIQNVLEANQHMSTEEGEPSTNVDDDPPIGALLETIEPCNDGFYPSRVASKAITKTIKQQYVQPLLTWGAMLNEEKELFFQRFKRKVTWRPEHEEKIRKIFNTKASHRLSEIFMEARKTGKKPNWMFDRVWNRLLAKWNQPKFRSKSTRNQKNRASEEGGCLHTSGSITIQELAIRMAHELGCPVYFDEVFHQTRV